MEHPIWNRNPVAGFACKLFYGGVEPAYSCLNRQAEPGVKVGDASGTPGRRASFSGKSGKKCLPLHLLIVRLLCLLCRGGSFSSTALVKLLPDSVKHLLFLLGNLL